MSEEENKQVIRQAIDAMNRGDPAAVGKLVAPGFVRHDLAGMVADARGREGVTDFLRMLQAAAPDLVLRIEDIFAVGDRVALRLSMEGTHQGDLLGVAPTGKRLEIAGINIYRFEDGKIAETWQMTDWAGMLRQVDARGASEAEAEANKALVDRVFDEVYSQGKLEPVDDLFAEDFVLHMPAREVRGREGVREMVLSFRAGFPDGQFAVEETVATVDGAVQRYWVTGTHLGTWIGIPPTKKQMRVQGMCVSRIVDGKVAEMWEIDDMLSAMQQGGLIPASAPVPQAEA